MASATLAARCPACLTVFRIVPDQLRVSQGWVRCGRCSEVFNATLSLVDVETGAPRKAAEALSPRAMGIEVVAAHEEPEWAQPRAAEDEAREPAQAEAYEAAEADEAQPAAAPLHAPAYAHEPAPGTRLEPRFDAAAAAEEGEDALPASPAKPAIDEPTTTSAPDAAWPDETSDTLETRATSEAPSFIRQADRAARWRRPQVRAALALSGLLAVLVLVGQILFEYRDLAAARFPEIRPALETACAALDCRIGNARAINSLSVESSGLVRVERSSIYRLQVALRNRAGIDVALPALDLSFTDGQGRLIARKVLRATELGVTQATLVAGRELALQATLQAGAAEPIAGYTIELFYP